MGRYTSVFPKVMNNGFHPRRFDRRVGNEGLKALHGPGGCQPIGGHGEAGSAETALRFKDTQAVKPGTPVANLALNKSISGSLEEINPLSLGESMGRLIKVSAPEA